MVEDNIKLEIDPGKFLDGLFSGGGKKGSASGNTARDLSRNITGGFGKKLGSFFSKTGVIGTLLNQSLEALNKIKDFMSSSSAQLKATFGIFEKAFRLFFKPYGDALSSLLRPLAFRLIKFAIAFNKFADKFSTGFGTGAVVGGVAGAAKGAAVGGVPGGIVGGIAGAAIGGGAGGLLEKGLKSVINKGSEIFENLVTTIDEKFGTNLRGQVIGAGNILAGGINFVAGIFSEEKREAAMQQISEGWNTFKTSVKESFDGLSDKARESFPGVFAFFDNVKNKYTELKEAFLEKIQSIKDFFTELKNKFIEGKNKMIENLQPIKDFFTSLKDNFINLKEKFSRWVDRFSFKSLFSKGRDFVSNKFDFGNDMIVTSSGKVIKTNPQDFIMATRDPTNLGGKGGGSGEVRIETVNINNATIRNDEDIRMLALKVKDELRNELRRATSYGF